MVTKHKVSLEQSNQKKKKASTRCQPAGDDVQDPLPLVTFPGADPPAPFISNWRGTDFFASPLNVVFVANLISNLFLEKTKSQQNVLKNAVFNRPFRPKKELVAPGSSTFREKNRGGRAEKLGTRRSRSKSELAKNGGQLWNGQDAKQSEVTRKEGVGLTWYCFGRLHIRQ